MVASIMASPAIFAAAAIALSRCILLPPDGRRLESAGPQPAPRGARLLLHGSIAAAAMARIVERMAAAHHGFAEVNAVDRAGGDVAVVLVHLDRRAGDAAAAHRRRQRAHRGAA